MSSSKKLLRRLFWTALCVYLLAVAAVLGVRYAILPQADNWRPRIEQAASDALGAPVRIGRVQAEWHGLHPRFTLAEVAISDAQGRPALAVPQVQAVLSWRSVLGGSPRFLYLSLDQMQVSLRRDAQNRLWLGERAFDLDGDGDGFSLDSPVLRWLGRQGDLAIRDARLSWRDELRGAPDLTLDDIELRIHNGLFGHQLALRARPPGALAAGIVVQGDFDRGFTQRPTARGGEIYAQVDDAEPLAWRPWLDVPEQARGRVATRAWGQLRDGRLDHVMVDVAARGLGASGVGKVAQREGSVPGDAGAGWQARIETLHLSAQGAPGDLLGDDAPAWLGRSSDHRGLALAVDARTLEVDVPRVFPQPLPPIDQVQAQLALQRAPGQPWQLRVAQADIVNADLDATLRGSWTAQGRTPAGSADFGGDIRRAAMNAIHLYLPRQVAASARQWLAHGLPRGQVNAGRYAVRGDLADFPFERPGEVGDFIVEGRVSGADIDYAPARDARLPWPMLQGVGGTVRIDKDALSIHARGGIVRTAPNRSVALLDVDAQIPHMSRGARLVLDGRTEGEAGAYLAMIKTSPLGRLLKGALDQARAGGHWTVPLALDIPLTDVNASQVRGSVTFDGSDFVLTPNAPPFRAVRGTLGFTERGVSTDGIRGRFLGGDYSLAGELTPGAPGLGFSGTLTSDGLRESSEAPVLKRLAGSARYEGKLVMDKRSGVAFSVDSDLRGMALDFPEPLGKPADTAMPLSVDWGAGDGGARRLTATLGGDVALQLEQQPKAGAEPFFQRGVLGIGRPAALPESGLRVDVALRSIDLNAWQTVNQQAPANLPVSRGAPRTAASLLPRLADVRVETQALTLGNTTLEDVRAQATPQDGGAWQITLASEQVSGDLNWRAPTAEQAGRLQARLDHLALGKASDTAAASSSAAPAGKRPAATPAAADTRLFDDDTFKDVPDVDLRAERLELYGKPAGSLVLRGANQVRGQHWRLDTLALSHPSGRVSASGDWRLAGAARGISLDTRLDVSNLGRLLSSVGQDELVAEGKGHAQASLMWQGFPWRKDFSALRGDGEVALDAGRLLGVKSGGARLLELLALQSTQRLARLDFNPGAAVTRGFSFDTVRGKFKAEAGQITTPGLKVDGPAATVVLAGSSDLARETWDMQAVVVPNLDAGGAAIAAGIAINPVLGIGAFVTQWLLKEPLARAMTVQYSVTGPWDDPQVRNVDSVARREQPAEQPLP